MACGNCANCGDSSKGASQRSLVAYIQPCGAGPEKDALNAMVDGNYQSTIKVTGGQRQIRGSRTAKRKRTSSGSSQLCYYTESSPGENTISLEFASCGCGGYSPEELSAEGTFDLYQLQACCGTADMTGGWSKMHVYRCISFNSISFNDEASFDPDDDNDLTMSFDANYVEDYYIYPLTLGEVVGATGLDSGARIDSIVFPGATKGCKASCKDDCAGNWYSVTDEGRIIYRTGSDKAIKISSIPGFVTTSTRIGMVGTKLFVTVPGGYYSTTVSDAGDPGTWVFTSVPGLNPDSVFSGDDAIYASGVGGIWKIDANGLITRPLTTSPSSISGYDECGGTSVAGGTDGRVYIGSTCGSMTQTAVQPAAVIINTVAIQPGGNVWVGTATGTLLYTDNGGASWTTVPLPFNPTAIVDMKWVDSGVGYIVTGNPAAIYSTEDGGNTWTRNGTDSRFSSVGNMNYPLSINIPCCTSKSKTANSVFVTGIANGNVGGIWQGSIASCS